MKNNPDILKEHMQMMNSFSQGSMLSSRISQKHNKHLFSEKQRENMHKFFKQANKNVKALFKKSTAKVRSSASYQHVSHALNKGMNLTDRIKQAGKYVSQMTNAFKKDPQKYINNSIVKLGDNIGKLGKQLQEKHAQTDLSTSKKNVQGLKLVPNENVKNGYQFVATKKTSFVYGQTKDGKPLKMTLNPGEKTGTIIASSAQDKRILKGYTQGNKYIKTAIEPGSTLEMNKLGDSNFLSHTAYIGQNSNVKLSGQGKLTNGTKIINSDLSTNREVGNTIVQNSNVNNIAGYLKDSVINESSVTNSGNMTASLVDGSDVQNHGGLVHKAKLFNTEVNNPRNRQISNSVISTAKVYNSDVATANLQNGTYDNSNIASSILRVNRGAKINSSKMFMSQVHMPDIRSSKFNLDNSHVSNSTLTIPAGKHQNIQNSILKNALTTDNVDLNHSDLQNEKHTNVFRNFQADNLNAHLQDNDVAFDNKALTGAKFGKDKDKLFTDKNIPETSVITGSPDLSDFLHNNNGLTGKELHSNKQFSLSKQISAILNKFIPQHRPQHLKANSFFKEPMANAPEPVKAANKPAKSIAKADVDIDM